MDIVMIKCPNCGAANERREGEYFLKCPYCGMEICFDDIKEEAQIGVLQNKLSELEQDSREVEAARQLLKKYRSMRNISFALMCLLTIIGFDTVTFADEDSAAMGFGVMMCLAAEIIALVMPVVLALVYPGYDIIMGATDRFKTVKKWIKLALITVGLQLISLIAAFIIEEIISFVAG